MSLCSCTFYSEIVIIGSETKLLPSFSSLFLSTVGGNYVGTWEGIEGIQFWDCDGSDQELNERSWGNDHELLISITFYAPFALLFGICYCSVFIELEESREFTDGSVGGRGFWGSLTKTAGNLQIPSATTWGGVQYSHVYWDVSPIV